MDESKHPYRRYVVAVGLLLLLALGLPAATWESDVHVHTILEVAATVLAAVVGSLALVRFYSKKSNRFLFVGTGFLATALFDGYHGVVTSEWFYRGFPSDLPELIPWSWLVSRLFLGILLWLSVVARQRSDEEQEKRSDVMVYLVVSLLALVFFVFFTQDSLPQAYQEEWILHRPMELVPALFFLLALIGYYRKGDWRHDAFSRWLLLALIVNLAVQALFMPFSNALYDGMFDAAHLLKIVSYAFVFVGLASSMSELVQQVEQGLLRLRKVNNELQHEIGERQRAQEEILVYQDIVKNMQVGVMVFNLEEKEAAGSAQDAGTLRIEIANETAGRFLGRSVASILGTRLADSFPDSLSRHFPQVLRKVILTSQTRDLGEIHYVGDGIDEFFGIKVFPLPNDSVGVIFDNVTERKEAEEQLRERTTQLAEAQRLAHMGSWTWHTRSGQVTWSDELYRIFGYEPQSFPVTIDTFMEHVHPDDQEMVTNTLQRVLENHEELLYYPRIVRPDGEVRILHGRGSVVIDENKQPVRMWGTAQDVTERQRASDALRESELRFRSVAKSANDAIVSADSQGQIVYWNPAAQRIFGYEESQALGMPLTELMLESYITEHHDRVSGLPSQNVQVIGESIEMEGRHKEGRRFPIEVSLASWKVGEDDFYTAIIRDISKRKRKEEELKTFAAKLEASNRELQEFAYIASHDLQEPLRKINAFSDRLKSRYGESLPDRAKDYLERMQSAATRMQQLIEDLLTLSRVTTKGRPFVEVDLMKVANEVVDDLETSISESNGQVEIAQLPTIDADPTQMRQLFQNTIGNALKFSRKGVPPVVKVASRPLVDEESYSQEIEITIEDNGIGFNEKYIDRIFQPFQRLHGRTKYSGTGMGLAICRKIAERHRGRITATSTPEEGTTIIITLPIKQLFEQDPPKESTL